MTSEYEELKQWLVALGELSVTHETRTKTLATIRAIEKLEADNERLLSDYAGRTEEWLYANESAERAEAELAEAERIKENYAGLLETAGGLRTIISQLKAELSAAQEKLKACEKLANDLDSVADYLTASPPSYYAKRIRSALSD